MGLRLTGRQCTARDCQNTGLQSVGSRGSRSTAPRKPSLLLPLQPQQGGQRTQRRSQGGFLCHAGTSGDGEGPSPDSPGEGGGLSFDMSVLSDRIREVETNETAECQRNWLEGRCTYHTVAVLDQWVRKLALHGESVACGTHTGECYIIDGLCGRGTATNLYPDALQSEQGSGPSMTACRIRRYLGLEAETTALDFNGENLVAGTKDGSVRLWCAQAGCGVSCDAGNAVQVLAGMPGESTVFSGHTAPVSHVQLVNSGSQLVTGSLDGTIRVWDSRSGDVLVKIPAGSAVTSMHCSDYYITAGLKDGRVVVWSTPRERRASPPKPILSFLAHNSSVTAINFLRDENFDQDVLVTGCDDGVLRSWDFSDGGAWMQEFVGHAAEVVSLQFDEFKLVSASRDGTIRFWDLRSGKSLYGMWGHTAYMGSVTFDKSRLVSDGTNNAICLHDFGPGAPPKEAELDS